MLSIELMVYCRVIFDILAIDNQLMVLQGINREYKKNLSPQLWLPNERL